MKETEAVKTNLGRDHEFRQGTVKTPLLGAIREQGQSVSRPQKATQKAGEK